MKKGYQKSIEYKKERVILSDTLPYEVPPFFSNRHFYNFLIQNKVELIENRLKFKKDDSGVLGQIVSLLFGLKTTDLNKSELNYDFFNVEKKYITIPFRFKISHKEKDYRELNVIHPINQLMLIPFYDKYKHTILKLSQTSAFSLRVPSKIASLKYFKDKTNKLKKSNSSEFQIIETDDNEYTSLKTYFSYKKYSNVYQFYESHDFHKAEKKFNNLIKFDIARCFDSIYTHTLPWATISKKAVKDNLNFKDDIFGGRFDFIMQKMNYNETNGIVIGPEFSRIFSELILQRIDKDVELELVTKDIKYKEDYDVCRYVDDYFLFYSDEKIRDEIIAIFKLKLQNYNLFLNDSKTKIYEQPIMTNISIAKERIRKLIDSSMIFRFFDRENKNQIGVKHYTAKDIKTNYKLILSETGTSYKDLQNYFLATIFNKTKKIIAQYQSEQSKYIDLGYKLKSFDIEPSIKEDTIDSIQKRIELKSSFEEQTELLKGYNRQIIQNLNEIIELTFFIYSVLPRVTYSIKVCHILYRIIDFVKNQEITFQKNQGKFIAKGLDIKLINPIVFDEKHLIFKSVYDGVNVVLKKNNLERYSEVETLYLLQMVNELGNQYFLPESLLISHFKVLVTKGSSEKLNELNYFTIISLLNHIRLDVKYDKLREILKNIILKRFEKYDPSKAEFCFMTIDLLSCPYVGKDDSEIKEFRLKILESIKFFDSKITASEKTTIVEKLSKFGSSWFYKWTNGDFGKELNTKRGHNVY